MQMWSTLQQMAWPSLCGQRIIARWFVEIRCSTWPMVHEWVMQQTPPTMWFLLIMTGEDTYSKCFSTATWWINLQCADVAKSVWLYYFLSINPIDSLSSHINHRHSDLLQPISRFATLNRSPIILLFFIITWTKPIHLSK